MLFAVGQSVPTQAPRGDKTSQDEAEGSERRDGVVPYAERREPTANEVPGDLCLFFESRNFEGRGKPSKALEGVVPYVESAEATA